jgi:glycosyltransferase involved in cell wall biosynthesis
MDLGYRRADRVIVHGRRHVETVRDKIGIPQHRIHFVPHVAIGDRVDFGVGTPEDDNTVLFFGRIWGYKGLEYLIRAEPLISREIPAVRIIIAGKGEDFEKYRKLMVNPARFEVHDAWVTDGDRCGFFQRAAVVALPYISASQSGVIPIAFSHAKPVVATCVGALPEYVDHGRTGLLVPPRDERALAEAIVTLLKNRQKRHEMGVAGRRKLHDEWAPSVVVAATVDVYEHAIRDRAATRSRRGK